MEKHTVNVPGAEEFASRPRSRRDFFKTLAAASAGAAGGSLLLSGKASAQSASASASASASSASASASASATSDIEIANFALTLEFLEEEFYSLALDAGVLSGDALAVVENLQSHEAQHVDAITGLIEQFGGTPVAKPEFVFPPESLASQAGVLELANTLEPTGVGAYLGAGPMIHNKDVLAAAGSIEGVEGEHVVAIRWLLGLVPFANEAFPKALMMDEVLAAVAPFIMGGMMETGGGQYRDRNSFGRV